MTTAGNPVIYVTYFFILEFSTATAFIVRPVDTLVQLGDSTQLNCTYNGAPALKAWYRGTTLIALGNSLQNSTENYELISERNVYNLRLLNATLNDEGEYDCTDVAERTRGAKASIYVIYSVPNCSTSNSGVAIEGENEMFKCVIDMKEGAPGDLVWLKDGKEVSRKEGHNNTWETQLSRSDNNAIFDCQLQHETLPQWKWSEISCAAKIQIDVQYSPDVSIVKHSHNPMREGSEFSAICEVVDANPDKINDEYWIDPERHKVSYNRSLSLVNVSRQDSGEYTCVMTNVFHNEVKGNGTATIEVDIQYLSYVNMTVSPSLNTTEGAEVTVHCESLNGHPDSHKLELSHKETVIDESNTQTLHYTIPSIEGSHGGIYQCNAYTLFDDGKEEYSFMKQEVIVYFSPKIDSEETRFEASIGDTVSMPCKVYGFPTPSISWFDENESLIPGDEENKKITGKTTETEHTVTSTLTVTVADESYYGRYICKATNNIEPNGEKVMEIVKRHDSSGSNSTIIAIAVTVTSVVVVAIVLVFLCYYRRTVKKGKVKKTNTNTGRADDGDQAELAESYEKDRQEPDGGSQEFELIRCSDPAAISTKALIEGERPSSERNPSSVNADGNQGDNPSALYAVPHKEKKTQHAGDTSNVSGSDGKVTVTDQPPPQDITVSQKQSRTSKKERDPKEDLAYADLDLTGSGVPDTQNKPPDTEKTQYATIMHASSNP